MPKYNYAWTVTEYRQNDYFHKMAFRISDKEAPITLGITLSTNL